MIEAKHTNSQKLGFLTTALSLSMGLGFVPRRTATLLTKKGGPGRRSRADMEARVCKKETLPVRATDLFPGL